MKKETPEEFKDSLIQEIIKLKGLTGNYSFQFLALSGKEILELITTGATIQAATEI